MFTRRAGAALKLGLALVLACALAGCSNGGIITAGPPTASPGLTIAGSGAAKAPIAGLIDMQDISWHLTDAGQPAFLITNVQQFPGIFGGIVINATWSQMQSAQGATPDFSVVDADLHLVKMYNDANPSAPLGVKLRIYNGDNAPNWTKHLAGGPIPVFRNPGGCSNQTDTCPETIGALWSSAYINAWRSFQAQVAARYDANPLVRAVAVTSCATQTDEPFVPTTGPIAKTNLDHAVTPYTDAAEQACLTGAIDDYAAWTQTEIDYTFNTFVKFAGGVDLAFTTGVMELCRSKLGARCVLDNHALSSPPSSGDQGVYTEMQTLGGLIDFQTQSPNAMGCIWPETISQGVQLGARAIEIWPAFGGFTTLTMADMLVLQGEFQAPTPIAMGPLPSGCSGFN